ncbi:MAG: hypothetical protein GX446_17905 [Chthonomonadales bacterium]|nr:hypothetical protein [Chthonomonadales bacterium]
MTDPLSAADAASRPPVTVVFDVTGLQWDELCTVEALQGLVNRQGPRLYLHHGEPADRRWLDIYSERAGLTYERVASMPELLKRFRPACRGLVVYDAAVDGCRYVAITMAGVETLLPVSPAVLEGSSPAMRVDGQALPLSSLGYRIVQDLRGRFGSSISAYEWALTELMPRCSRRLAHSVDGGRVDGILTGVCGPMSGFDWQVMNKGFVFNLGAQARKMVSYGAEVGGDPAHAAMYERILRALRTPAQITGYGDPEDFWCLLLSRHGHYSFHAFHNWSFHSKVPARMEALRQAVRPSPDLVKPETDRYYVCFMTSEGDTMKGPLPFFYDSWFDPARGTVPINWGINPLMARLFPAMLDYYYATATPNDGFFAGPSGAGYTYPDVMPNVAEFGRHTRRFGRLADVACFDLWGAARPDVLETYGRASRPLGLSTFTTPARMWFLSDGTPVVHHELGYWQTYGLGSDPWPRAFADAAERARAIRRLVQRIERIASRVRPPFIILVYGDLHSYARHASLYAEVAAALDPARFRPARLDEAFAGVRAWAQQRIMVGTHSINEKPAWAVLSETTTRLPLRLTNGRNRRSAVSITTAGAHPVRAELKAHEVRDVAALTVSPGARLPGTVQVTVSASGSEERLDVDTVVVPGGRTHTSISCMGVFGADYMGHPSGEALADADALRGSAWLTPRPDGQYRCVVSGPYAAMAKGRYAVAFRLRRVGDAPAASDVKAVTLDIASGGYGATGGVRAQKTIAALALGSEWSWHVVEAEWLGLPDLMETRVWSHGTLRVAVDRIAVFHIGP